MIRRTLAIAGAAVLAIGVSGLAGPASADPGAGTAQQSQALIAEVMVNMETTVDGIDLRGDAIELQEITGNEPFALDDFALIGCSDVQSFTIIQDFGPNAEIPAGGSYLIADNEYDDAQGPLRDVSFDLSSSPTPDLVQSAGGVRLVDASSLPVDDVRWGTAPFACSSYFDADKVPNDSQSLNWTGTAWELRSPTPANTTS